MKVIIGDKKVYHVRKLKKRVYKCKICHKSKLKGIGTFALRSVRMVGKNSINPNVAHLVKNAGRVYSVEKFVINVKI